MRETLIQKWWVLFFRGSFSVIFGILAIFFPAVSLTSLVLLFGIYALLDGAFSSYHALAERDENANWAWNLADGLISMLAGLVALVLTPLAGVTLLVVIGIYAIFTGLVQLITAWRLRDSAPHEWLLGISSVTSIVFGVLVLVFPLPSAIAVAMLIGVYAIAFGLMRMSVSLRYRQLATYHQNGRFGALDKTEPLPGAW